MAYKLRLGVFTMTKRENTAKKVTKVTTEKKLIKDIDRNSEETACGDHFMEVNIIKDRNYPKVL